MKKSDVPYFLTIKLSWNEHNEFPHNTFLWQGIDGSEVLAHMPPENTYNSGAMPSSLRNAEKNFKDKDISGDALILFGIGDGGGGPSTDHLEYLSREKSIAGLPQTRQQHALEFFDRINEHRGEYAKWRGELYLEKHQGTYTTQSDCKKNNRFMEFALRDCEFVCSMASVLTDFEYPQQELEEIWKEVLLYQFHDILPGSSIKRVYDEANARYEILRSQVEKITKDAGSALALSMGVSQGDTLLVNTLGFERAETIGTSGDVKSVTVPAYGFAAASGADAFASNPAVVENGVLENGLLRVELSKEGTLLSIYDKQCDREVLNQSWDYNNLVIYDDRGDCWDIPFTYRDKRPKRLVADSMYVENGSLKFTYKYKASSFVQTVSLSENAKKLVFGVSCDWQETFKMLRGVYPIDISTDYANCNIQFGHIRRPTHKNTSWDRAMIEICAHKWIDLSEEGYGVSLINNCKYGFNVWDNCLDIDLLRSQMYPGENADKGSHEFTYELFIHDGDLLKVTEESYKFNVPVVKADGVSEESRCGAQSFFAVAQPNVLIETVKLAEDGSGIVLRLYECTGRRTKTKVTANGIKSAQLVSMTEQDIEPLITENSSFELTFKPFEIHTVKVKY